MLITYNVFGMLWACMGTSRSMLEAQRLLTFLEGGCADRLARQLAFCKAHMYSSLAE